MLMIIILPSIIQVITSFYRGLFCLSSFFLVLLLGEKRRQTKRAGERKTRVRGLEKYFSHGGDWLLTP